MNEQDQIKAWLAFRGLKPYQLAKKAGVSYSVIYRFLAGKRDIRVSTLNKIKEAMK